ncbi:hypothetical protein [Campylobacter fetus]|nr:hypothetical protein [Campylobacter fetus]
MNIVNISDFELEKTKPCLDEEVGGDHYKDIAIARDCCFKCVFLG